MFVKFRENEYQLLCALRAGEAVFTWEADILHLPLAAHLTQQVTRVVYVTKRGPCVALTSIQMSMLLLSGCVFFLTNYSILLNSIFSFIKMEPQFLLHRAVISVR